MRNYLLYCYKQKKISNGVFLCNYHICNQIISLVISLPSLQWKAMASQSVTALQRRCIILCFLLQNIPNPTEITVRKFGVNCCDTDTAKERCPLVVPRLLD